MLGSAARAAERTAPIEAPSTEPIDVLLAGVVWVIAWKFEWSRRAGTKLARGAPALAAGLPAAVSSWTGAGGA